MHTCGYQFQLDLASNSVKNLYGSGGIESNYTLSNRFEWYQCDSHFRFCIIEEGSRSGDCRFGKSSIVTCNQESLFNFLRRDKKTKTARAKGSLKKVVWSHFQRHNNAITFIAEKKKKKWNDWSLVRSNFFEKITKQDSWIAHWLLC